ncbi:MAG: hypothetical protein JO000_08155 [Alphaproteobacteria bacterium]|nr:hypothetical protein [Alphaproteobacteria bacterium]
MRKILAIAQFVLLVGLSATSAQAQTVTGAATIALKNGESATIGNIYWVSHCRSMLKGPPEVEVLEGPPGLTATITEAMVLPRAQKCANKVSGGTLVVSAKDIEDASLTPVTLRITYHTRDGDRKLSHILNVSLLP